MAHLFTVHPQTPQTRLLQQAADLLTRGGILAVPTDSSYALMARLDDKQAADNLRRIRGIDERSLLTLMCRDLSEIAKMAKVDNQQYRLLKAATPGPWTFILNATAEVPRRLSHPSRKTIGIRVSEHPVTQALLALLDEPVLSSTFILPGQTEPLNDPELIAEKYSQGLAGIIDSGPCLLESTTIIDLTTTEPTLIRLGRGDPTTLGIQYD